MEFFGDLSVPVTFVIAVVVALAILGAGGYLMRRFRPARTEPRLAVINAASVDGRRRLVLVRRDNVEHLLLIGGPTDAVIEPNIGRTGAATTAPAPVRAPRASPPPKPPPRQTSSLAMAREPVPREPMPREAMTHDAMLRPPPVERQRRETVTEEAGAPHPPDAGPALRPSFELAARMPPAPEAKHTPAPRLPQRAAQDDESIFAEMALRLQTALRGPIEPVEPTQSPPAPEPRFASAPATLPTSLAHPMPLREAAPPATSAPRAGPERR